MAKFYFISEDEVSGTTKVKKTLKSEIIENGRFNKILRAFY